MSQGEADDPMPLYRTSWHCRASGDLDGWRQAVTEALARPHDTWQQLYVRAMTKILLGDWTGWVDYEARHHLPSRVGADVFLARDICWRHRQWDGREPIRQKALLVVFEQGLGDEIQMLRFLPEIVNCAGRVMVMINPVLAPLVTHVFGRLVTVCLEGVEPSVHYDRYVWGMSLPAIVGRVPEFHPFTVSGRQWRARSKPERSRAGICWSGNPQNPHNLERSIPISMVEPLVTRPDIEWYSLQVGPQAVDAETFAQIRRPQAPLFNMLQTAELLLDLDYVVTVDTAIAHLAGSLGVPTYLMLSSVADWRWGLGDRTEWYPSVRLIRQLKADDWTHVIAALNQLLEGRRASSIGVHNET